MLFAIWKCPSCFNMLLFLPLKAKKEEDEDEMEDLQRWAMEAM